MILWAFVFVDDFIFILSADKAETIALQTILFLQALGLPISWKKVATGSPNTWLGYLITTSPIRACLTPDKQTTIVQMLTLLMSDQHMTLKSAQQAAGRLNWATMIYPLMRPFLQPIYTWVTALNKRQERQRAPIRERTTKAIRLVAKTLLDLFSELPPPADTASRHFHLHAASDAGARQGLEGSDAYIGGWYSTTPLKSSAYWFCIQINQKQHPWAYEKGDPQLHIGALELYASLLLYRTILNDKASKPDSVQMTLRLATDNKGNAYQVTNHRAKNTTAASMLMEMALTQHIKGVALSLRHTYRELNTWADQLTHADYTGFHPERRLYPDESNWHILDKLIRLPAPTTADGP